MGANDAKEMLEVAKAECLRLERENTALRAQVVPQPDRAVIARLILAVDSDPESVTIDVIENNRPWKIALAQADAVLAALSTQPAAGEVESAKAAAWDEGALYAAVECGAIRDERNAWLASGDNPYRASIEQTEAE